FPRHPFGERTHFDKQTHRLSSGGAPAQNELPASGATEAFTCVVPPRKLSFPDVPASNLSCHGVLRNGVIMKRIVVVLAALMLALAIYLPFANAELKPNALRRPLKVRLALIVHSE